MQDRLRAVAYLAPVVMTVMAALDPAIYAPPGGWWIAGSSPAMTAG